MKPLRWGAALFGVVCTLSGCGGRIGDDPAYGLPGSRRDGGVDAPPDVPGGCAPLTLCGERCVDLTNDSANCGACGRACVDGVCRGGVCGPPDPCPAPLVRCGFGGCVDLNSDPSNCGKCGLSCGAGRCEGARCVGAGEGDGTTGRLCTEDGFCNPSGDGRSHCGLLDVIGEEYSPSRVCIRDGCVVEGGGARATPCDRGAGVCVPTADDSTGVCLGSCAFDGESGRAASCPGNNVCRATWWKMDSEGRSSGVGFCFGGCAKNSDCASGFCDKAYGYCSSGPLSTLKPGEACNSGDSACNCAANLLGTGEGFCTLACRVGDPSSCGPGFACDPLDTADFETGESIRIKTMPPGIAGYCLKLCKLDGDCASLPGAVCAQTEGLTFTTCHPR